MPTGVFPSNPTELLGNERFQQLSTVLRESFEYVIVDTPPIGNVIDAAVAAKQCDGTILVMAADRISKGDAIAATEQMRAANENILGVVLNKVDLKDSSYYGKYGTYRNRYDKYSY